MVSHHHIIMMYLLAWGEGFFAYAIADALNRTNEISWHYAMLLGCATSSFLATHINHACNAICIACLQPRTQYRMEMEITSRDSAAAPAPAPAPPEESVGTAIRDQSFLSAGYYLGVDTSSLKPRLHDIRRDIPNPRHRHPSIWNNGTRHL